MIQRLVDKIINRQIKNKTILENEVNIYRYGYFLLFEILINIIISIFIGMMFRDMETILVFLFMYVPLRTYSGGWHANKLWKCTLISNLILVIAEVIINYWIEYISVTNGLFVAIWCVVLILVFSPVDTETKILNEVEKKIYKRKTYVIAMIQICIMCFCIVFSKNKYSIIIEYTYFIQALMLIVEKIKRCSKIKIKY
ncbi:MAG: accessory gene regulator B family protein [Lachnospiraceae bacterium]|nr:accessory gene regulator B family protein [Lachnospiraceae bacterium]